MATNNGTNLFSDISATLSIALTDGNDLAIFAKCVGAPPSTAGLFAHGCLIVRTDSGTNNSSIYENKGTAASPSWSLIGSAVTTSPLIVGDGASNATIKSNGNFDLILQTGNATTGSITIADGANGQITIAPNGSGVTSVGSSSGTASLEGFVLLNGPVSIGDVPVAYNANGAISVNKTFVEINTGTSGAIALTLADAAVQRVMFIRMTADGGDAVLTPTNLINGTTITFDTEGDTAFLVYSTGGWAFMGGTATLA